MVNSGTHHTHTYTHAHITKNTVEIVFNDKLFVTCLSVQCSVMERPPTAGVWTRTGGKSLAPDHTVQSNLHVSTASPVLHVTSIMAEIFVFLKSITSRLTGLPSVAPPTVRPLPRPSVTPPTNTDITLLYAQGQKIGALPLKGTKLDASESKTLLTLHVRDVKRVTTQREVKRNITKEANLMFVCVCPGFHSCRYSL